MAKFDLSSYEAITVSAKQSKERANNAPNQASYNAGWLHGYADALKDVVDQINRPAAIFNNILAYLAELWKDEQLYDVLHNSVGISNDELEKLGFDLKKQYIDEE